MNPIRLPSLSQVFNRQLPPIREVIGDLMAAFAPAAPVERIELPPIIAAAPALQQQPQQQPDQQPQQQQQRRRRGRPRLQQPIHNINIDQFSCGARTKICQHCSAMLFPKENDTLCCQGGRFRLPALGQCPADLQRLLEGNDARSRAFQLNIRAYNSALAFTSTGVQLDRNLTPNGIFTYRIHGSIYHRIGSLLPGEGEAPKFAQLYMVDPGTELQARMAAVDGLSEATLETLQQLLHANNPLVHQFRQAVERHHQQPAAQLKFVIRAAGGADRHVRRFNAPTVEELAAFVPGDGTQQTSGRDIVLSMRDGPLRRISELNCAYDPLRYVLLFPNGEPGWHINYTDLDGQKVTAEKYYRYRLMERAGQFNILHRSRRLLHEWIVDQYVKVEQDRLNFIRRNQDTLRADLYRGVVDALMNDQVDANAVGRKVILPSSFTGSPRYMHQKCQDALAVAARFGKATYFITITTNPNWDEIVEAAGTKGVNPQDDPIIVARVFHLKLQQLMEELKNGLFGRMIAVQHTVEFQKRGLPHAHILLTVDHADRPHTAEQVDEIVCAEIPDINADPVLHRLVLKHMLHGPCGNSNPNAPCLKGDRCSKSFPKDYQPATAVHEDGFPLYRRRDNGVRVEKGGVDLDNRWVVPYNPYLLKRFNCHTNVEICTNLTAIKYLYKYVTKGNDMATVEVGAANANGAIERQRRENHDEVTQFLEGRYISASEAAWRLLGFRLFSTYPSVERLPVHTDGGQFVTFDAAAPPEQIIQNLQRDSSRLQAWFRLNREDEEARQFKYCEIPEHYVWHARHRQWRRRQRGGESHIGRMVFLSPAAGDVYYLRLLLTQTAGGLSFEHLRTHEGVLYDTYKACCIARGLLADDAEPRTCLEEASLSQLPSKLRQLFAVVLIHSEVADPLALWMRFRNDMSQDHHHRLQRELPNMEDELRRDNACQLALTDIANHLLIHGRRLQDYPGMPVVVAVPNQRRNPLLAAAENYDVADLTAQVERNVPLFNQEQREFYTAVMHQTDNPQADGNIFFLDGPGGTGKTFVWNTILAKFRSSRKIALSVASSAVAAGLLDGGRTAHSMFKIPVNGITETSSCGVGAHTDLAGLIRTADLIIWDECPMVHKHALMAVERTLRDIMRTVDPAMGERLFGGKLILLGGDFRQVLPVVPRGSRAQTVDAAISRAPFWPRVRRFRLRTNMRVQRAVGDAAAEMQEFSDWLLRVGDGADANIAIPPNMRSRSLNDMISSVFPDDVINGADRIPIDRAILAPLNTDVDGINAQILQAMRGEQFTYLSRDSLLDDGGNPRFERNRPNYPPEFLNAQEPPGCSPHRLLLKVGCPVLLLRNIDVNAGLCNGTRLWVRRCHRRVIEAEIATGRNAGDVVFIPRIPINVQHPNIPFQFSRMQFPLKLAFAVTINKSQGQTLSKVGLCLQSQVFSHGQLYVALSRATTPAGIHILNGEQDPAILTNVVYREAL